MCYEGPHYKRGSADTHDFVLFMANTDLRPDEAKRPEHRDVKIVHEDATDEVIPLLEVRGKRGVEHCKSMLGALHPYRRLNKRHDAKPTDTVFAKFSYELSIAILDEEGLKFDRERQPRTPYSLRPTYISFRLMEGADIYQIAKTCRTSVEMIQKCYASHIVTSLDAAAINVRKPKPVKTRLKEALAEETADLS